MISHRHVIQKIVLVSGCVVAENLLAGTVNMKKVTWLMPDEAAPHKRTWMAFGANDKIWGYGLLPEVQENLATIACTIAKYELGIHALPRSRYSANKY